jgi:hypothetical protein
MYIGPPIESARKQAGLYAWSRKFSQGMVLLNFEMAKDVEFTLDKTYLSYSRARYTGSVTLPARTGLVLISDPAAYKDCSVSIKSITCTSSTLSPNTACTVQVKIANQHPYDLQLNRPAGCVKLQFWQGGQDISDQFTVDSLISQTLLAAGTTRYIQFRVVPASDASPGPVTIDAQVYAIPLLGSSSIVPLQTCSMASGEWPLPKSLKLTIGE